MGQSFTPSAGGSFGGGSSFPTSPSFSPAAAPGGLPGTAPGGSRPASTSEPVERLVPSLVAGVGSLVLNAVLWLGGFTATGTSWLYIAVIAWALAGVAGILPLGFYFAEVNNRKAGGYFLSAGWKKTLSWVTFAVLVGAVLWSATDIALWWGKQ